MISFSCPRCKKSAQASDDLAGKIVRCPDCGQRCQIPYLAEKKTPANTHPAKKPKPDTEITPFPQDGLPSSASRYYYLKGDKQFGPYTQNELKELAAGGVVERSDLLWKEGWPEWRVAGKAKGLFPPADATNNLQDLDPVRAKKYLDSAQAHLDREDFWIALDDLNRALKLDPTNPEAFATRALIYAKWANDYRQALADFAEAIRLDPENAVLLELRAVLYREKGYATAAEKDEKQAARLKSGRK